MSGMWAMFVVISVLVVPFLWVSEGMATSGRSGYVKTNQGDVAYPDLLDVRDVPKHHHHHPDFHHHHHYHDNFDGWYGKSTGRDDGHRGYNETVQIPLDFIQNINKYNLSDLLINFVEGEDDEDEGFIIQDRFGDIDGQERNAATMPKEAACMPELQTVKIVTTNDPSVLYIPQCTRIERCGGCCSHALLSCQPQATESVSFKVIKTQYTGGKKLKYIGKEVVVVEKHTKCKCDCRVQAKDCNRFQEYKKAECRCACTNFDEEKKCSKNNETKLWNPDLCACQCRDVMQCSTGYFFDQNECRCMAVPMKRRFANYERKSYREEPPPVEPLFEGEY